MKAGLRRSPSKSLACLDGEELQSYSVGLLSEYLTSAWRSKLADSLGMDAQRQEKPEGQQAGQVEKHISSCLVPRGV